MFKGSNVMRSISEVTKEQTIASTDMMDAISTWLAMFSNDSKWLKKNPVTLGLPAIIASEIARSVTLEMEVNISGSEMADFINEQFEEVRKNIRVNTEYACAGGGIVFKPYVSDGRIVTEVVQADYFCPVAYNNSHKITAAYFLYRSWKGKKVYSRLERHELDGTVYKITNRAYVSSVEEAIGTPCSLAEVEDWADIEPEVVINDIESPLFAYFRIPIGNTVDKNSPLGVSVYARAVRLIRDADEQYRRLLWEYEGGELAIDAAEDAFKRVNGIPVLPKGKERLYRTNNLDSATASTDALMKEWAPSLRDTNYMSGLNRILLQIEDACCLSRGTLSDVDAVARSATEIKIIKQRSYSTVTDIQKSLEYALDDLAYAMYALANLYKLAPNGKYNATYVWDDSIIVDSDLERMRDQEEVAKGLKAKYEYRMKWYGEDELTARKICDEIDGLSDDQILGFAKIANGEEDEDLEEDKETNGQDVDKKKTTATAGKKSK